MSGTPPLALDAVSPYSTICARQSRKDLPMSRFDDALYIQMGACNPTAITGTLHRHMLDMQKNEPMVAIREDPALRMIAHQLAYLMGLPSIMDSEDYNKCVDACKAKAVQSTLDMWNRR
jgi:hypothetical protein